MYGIQRSFLEYDYGSRAVLDTKGSYEYTVHHSKRKQKARNIMQKVWLGSTWLACGPDNNDVRSCPIAMQTECRIFNRHQG
jgi:hypothetical protein